ncbi:mechanosensitive ion channel [Sulfitobacter sp. BDSS02]|nr:mechanosensitive ion channel [Sulfitobacter sp. BDSS02]MBR9849960.1 mechanosensitive ion channel family protein [Paracoccaceae bacterium]
MPAAISAKQPLGNGKATKPAVVRYEISQRRRNQQENTTLFMTKSFAAAFLTPLILLLCAFLLSIALPGRLAAQEPYFETDTLNEGLGDLPDDISRDTPMSSVESLLYATGRGEFEKAAHLLDLSGIDPAEQAARGAELAQMLSILIDRKVMIRWGALADRPDGWLEGGADTTTTGRVRRSIRIDVFELDDHNVPLRLNRIKPANGDPAWVISRQSVANLPQLYEIYGPTPIEKSLPSWAREKALWGMYLWEIIFVPVMLIIALLLGRLTYRGVTLLGRRANTPLGHSIVRALRWPATIAITAMLVGISTRHVLVVSGVVDTFISPAVLFGYIVAITLAAVLIIDELFDWFTLQNAAELADPDNAHLRNIATTISAARKFIVVIAVLVAMGVLLSSATTFQSLGLSLLASAGALTIVLGFAAREVLGNILASVQIALNRSARIGDQLIFEGRYCTVERIAFTYVQLLIWNGNRYIVPVSHFVKDAFENWSIEDVAMIRPIILTLTQEADVDRLRQFFLDSVRNDDGEDTGPIEEAGVSVIEQDVFGKKVRFELPTPHQNTGWDMQCRMRERLLEEAWRLQSEESLPMLPSAQLRDLPDS